jgi:hypothetical protein
MTDSSLLHAARTSRALERSFPITYQLFLRRKVHRPLSPPQRRILQFPGLLRTKKLSLNRRLDDGTIRQRTHENRIVVRLGHVWSAQHCASAVC